MAQRRGLKRLGWAAGATGVATWRLYAEGLLAEPFQPFADQAFQAVLVQRTQDPGLYANDAMVQALDGFWPDAWFQILARWTSLFPSLESAWSAATVGLAFLFLLGLVRLGERLSGSMVVGGLVALATAAVTRDSFIGEWGVVPLMPRFVVLCFAPWLLTALAPGGTKVGRRAAFFCGGLLASVHSLSAFQLVLCMAGVQCVTWSSTRRCRGLLLAGLLAGVGALPALFDLPQVQGAADLEALHSTSFAYYFQPPLYKALRILLQFGVLGALAIHGWREGRLERKPRQFLVALGGTALVLAALHPVCTLHPRSLALAPSRWLVYLFPVLLILAASGIARGIAASRVRRRVLAMVGLAVLLLPVPDRLYALAWNRWSWLGQRLDASLAARPELFQNTLGLGGQEQALRRLGEEVRVLVGRDEEILAPPRGASTLRLFTRRSLFVTAEDSVVALYDEAGFTEFQRRYGRAREAYLDDTGERLRALARHEGIRWVVVPEGGPQVGPVQARGAGLLLLGPLEDA